MAKKYEKPPCPGPSREWFFCEDCWSWQLKNIGGCPCWGAKVRELERAEEGSARRRAASPPDSLGTRSASESHAPQLDCSEPSPSEIEATRRLLG